MLKWIMPKDGMGRPMSGSRDAILVGPKYRTRYNYYTGGRNIGLTIAAIVKFGDRDWRLVGFVDKGAGPWKVWRGKHRSFSALTAAKKYVETHYRKYI